MTDSIPGVRGSPSLVKYLTKATETPASLCPLPNTFLSLPAEFITTTTDTPDNAANTTKAKRVRGGRREATDLGDVASAVCPMGAVFSQGLYLYPGALHFTQVSPHGWGGLTPVLTPCFSRDINSSHFASRNKPRQPQAASGRLSLLPEIQITGMSRWLKTITSHFSVAQGGREGSAIARDKICCDLCFSPIFCASPWIRSWCSGPIWQWLQVPQSGLCFSKSRTTGEVWVV